MFEAEHLQKMEKGILLFNEQKYWECHEALEDIWAEDAHDPIRYVYWVVIQVAAVCIHYRNKNLIGAQGMIAKAKEKFYRGRELNIVNELVCQNLSWNELETIVMKIPDSKSSQLEDFTELYQFKFQKFEKEQK